MNGWKDRVADLSWQLLGSIAIGYVFVLVLLPLGALFGKSLETGWAGFINNLIRPVALHSLLLTLGVSFIATLINGIFGLITAYVLVRYRFPGKALLNSFVDLPFAIPTAVSGLMLVAVYGANSPIGEILETIGIKISFALPGILLAVILVTFPFTIRALQPMLEEMEKETEEAAYILGASQWLTFRKVILPSILPGLFTGLTLSFARAMAEFGAVIVIAGNIPLKTQLAAVYIYGEMESYNSQGATSLSIILLILAVTLLVVLNLIARRRIKTDAKTSVS